MIGNHKISSLAQATFHSLNQKPMPLPKLLINVVIFASQQPTIHFQGYYYVHHQAKQIPKCPPKTSGYMKNKAKKVQKLQAIAMSQFSMSSSIIQSRCYMVAQTGCMKNSVFSIGQLKSGQFSNKQA